MENSKSPKAIDLIAAVMQVGVYGGISAGITYWLFDNATIGAIFGVGVYLALGMALISEDVTEFKRAIAATKIEG
jgi:hypothetical protein